MPKLYFLIAFLFTVHRISAQPTIQWQKTFGGKGSEIARQIIPTTDNGLLIAGTADISDGDVSGVHPSQVSRIGTDGSQFYDDDIWLIKLDAQQRIVWQKCLGGNAGDKPTKLLQTASGDIIVIANTSSGDLGGTRPIGNGEVLVTKLSSAGNLIWQKVFGGNGIDRAFSALEAANGDLIIVGQTNSVSGDVQNSKGGGDGWIFRVDSGGNLIWKNCLGTSGYEELYAIAATQNGYLAFGQAASSEYNKESSRVWVTKFSDDGTLVWQRNPVNQGNPTSVAILGTDYILAGYTKRQTLDGSRYDNDLWVARVDSAANLGWERTFGGRGEDVASSLIILPDTTIVIGGSTSSNEGQVFGKHGQLADNWLLNLNKTGDLRWQYSVGGTEKEGELEGATAYAVTDKLYAVGDLTLDSDGGIVWASFSQSKDGNLSTNRSYLNKPTNDLWVVKFEPEHLNSFQINLIQPPIFCNRQLKLPFYSKQPFEVDNTFSVELSDPAGSFAKPVQLSVNGTASPLTVNLPDTLRGGFGYRVRLIASSPKLISAPSNRFSPGNPVSATISGNSTVQSGAKATLQLNFTGSPPYAYTLSNGFSAVTNTESVTVGITTQTPTVYKIRSVANTCSSGSAQGMATVDIAYCTSLVYRSCQNSVRIEDFRLSTQTDVPLLINNNSGCSTKNYGDYTRLPTASVARLGRYKFLARLVGQNQSGNDFAIWIDLNQDRQLATNEIMFQRKFSQAATTIDDSFTIPASAKKGLTRMRIFMRYNSPAIDLEACYASDYGEYEDYSLFIQDSGEADLSLQLTASRQVVAINDPVLINTQLANNSLQDATNVYIANKLPPNFQFVSSSNFELNAQNELSSFVPVIKAGETLSLSFMAKVSAAGAYVNRIQITQSDMLDPDSRPNSGTEDGEDDASSVSFRTIETGNTVFISPNPNQVPLPAVLSNQPASDLTKADLSIRLSLSNQSIKVNEPNSLSLIVNNQGGKATGGITLKLVLPSDLSVMYNGQTITDTYSIQLSGSLDAGATRIVPIVVRASYTGSYTISAEITNADVADTDSVVNNGTTNGEDDTASVMLRAY